MGDDRGWFRVTAEQPKGGLGWTAGTAKSLQRQELLKYREGQHEREASAIATAVDLKGAAHSFNEGAHDC